MKIYADPKKCPQDHRCPAIAVCPSGAISQQSGHALPEIDGGKCIACGKCVRLCPKGVHGQGGVAALRKAA